MAALRGGKWLIGATCAGVAGVGLVGWRSAPAEGGDCCQRMANVNREANRVALLTQTATIALEDLSLDGMTQDWGSPGKDRSVDGNPLKIGGQSFAKGVGTHAESEININLFGSASRFTAQVGIDSEVGDKGSVNFQVIGDGKVLAESGVVKGGDSAKTITADLGGVKMLRLHVDDGGDGIDSDHADWVDAQISYSGKKPQATGSVAHEPTMAIYHNNSDRTEINGARIIGSTPGRDFLFRIPVSGRGPWNFKVDRLPPGLKLDASTGIIRGKLEGPGRWLVRVNVSGSSGSDARDLTIVGGPHDLALTPPMGWNSWNVWGTSVSAAKVKAAADSFIKTGLANYGYTFVNIDDAWEGSRDGSGEIQTNEKFGDMDALAKYVHGLGLKLGIYSSPGPKTCAGYEASYQHEQQDANTYAKWGIDYLKYDWCSYGGIAPHPDLPALQRPYIVMRGALDSCGRDIVFSLCQYGMGDVYNWGKLVGGNLWRTTGDITDTWRSMSGIGFSHSPKAVGAGPGGWNDPDMLVVGKLGWGDHPRPTRLTPNEQITHISLWSMLGAPLIIGCDLTQLDSFTKDLLTNHDVIEVDQDPIGKVATQRKVIGDSEIWARPLFDGSTAVGLFNRGPVHTKITVKWSDLGMSGSHEVRNLWTRRELGSYSDSFTADVPGHGTCLIKLH